MFDSLSAVGLKAPAAPTPPTSAQDWTPRDRRGPGSLFCKRALDIAVSGLVLLALWPALVLIALAIDWLMKSTISWMVLPNFIAVTMMLLAMLKLQDVEKFSSMFLNYDLLAQRWVPYGYIYPFAELVAGGLMLLVAAIVVEGAPPAMTSTNVLAYGAISLVATAIAFLCWFAGLRHLPAGTVGIIGLLNPVTGVLLGVLLAAESLASSQWWGLALVAAALVLGRSRHRAISVTGARTELRSGSRMDHVPRAPRG